MTSYWRRCDVTTSFRRHVPTRFLINHCQIITFLILKSDNIENSRIDLKGIILQVPSNQIKVTFIIILPFNLVHLWFFPVLHRNWTKMWVYYWGGGGGGGKGYVPPLSNYWGGGCPSPPNPTPSSYAYENALSIKEVMNNFLTRSVRIQLQSIQNNSGELTIRLFAKNCLPQKVQDNFEEKSFAGDAWALTLRCLRFLIFHRISRCLHMHLHFFSG